MREKVLKILLENLGKSVSGEDISHQLGITRAAIWKHINKLKEMGAAIESTTGGGYSLKQVPDWLNEQVFRHYNNTINVHIVDDTPSTNRLCMELADDNLPTNTIVISNTQSSGKGRLSRQWNSPSGGVWMSILVRPNLAPSAIPPITLLTAVAVSKALEEVFDGIKIDIKWPNDIHLNGKKLCGILVEANADIDGVRHVVVGIGLNANNQTKDMSDEVKDIATTLKDNGYITPRAQIASAILGNVTALVSQYENSEDISFINDYYTNHLLWKNKKVLLNNTGRNQIDCSGVLVGIGNKGELVVDCDGEERKIISGELSLRMADDKE